MAEAFDAAIAAFKTAGYAAVDAEVDVFTAMYAELSAGTGGDPGGGEPTEPTLSPIGAVLLAGGTGNLVTSGPTTWALPDTNNLIRNGVKDADGVGVTRLEVVAKYSNASETTVKGTNSYGTYVFDTAWNGAGQLGNGWVDTSVYSPPTSPPPPPPPPPTGDENAVGDVAARGGSLITTGNTWTLDASGFIQRNGNQVSEVTNVTELEVIKASDTETTVLATKANLSKHAFNLDLNVWMYRANDGEPTPVADGTWRDGIELSAGMPSNWTEGKLANGTWDPTYITQEGNFTSLKLDGAGSAQIQALEGKWTRGKFGVVVNHTNITRGGIVAAPLWLYSGYSEGYDGLGRFELDYEFIGNNGLQINYHDGIRPGKEVITIPGNYDGRDIKLEINYDMELGFADFIVDDQVVYHLTKAEVESWGMKWISKPMWPIYDLWATTNSGWTGGNFDPNQTSYSLLKSYKIDVT